MIYLYYKYHISINQHYSSILPSLFAFFAFSGTAFVDSAVAAALAAGFVALALVAEALARGGALPWRKNGGKMAEKWWENGGKWWENGGKMWEDVGSGLMILVILMWPCRFEGEHW